MDAEVPWMAALGQEWLFVGGLLGEEDSVGWVDWAWLWGSLTSLLLSPFWEWLHFPLAFWLPLLQ